MTVSRRPSRVRDRRRLLRRDRRVEQPLGRLDVQVVRDVEDVDDERALDRVPLQPQIEVAERDRVSRRPRRNDGRRRARRSNAELAERAEHDTLCGFSGFCVDRRVTARQW